MTTNTEIDHYDLESRGITEVIQEDSTQYGVDGKNGSTLTGIYAVGIDRVRVDIRLDFYDFQSSAAISLWDGTRWNRIADLTTAECGNCTHGTRFGAEQADRAPDLYQMEELRNRLISIGLGVVCR